MATRKITDKVKDAILKQLVKNFGPGYNTTGVLEENLEAIPTGHDDLDRLLTLGAHGIAKGCIVELMGSEGSGKCLTRDTYCLTQQGMMTIEEIFELNDIPCDASEGFVECEYSILNENKEFEKTSHFYRNNYGDSIKIFEITTKDGFVIKGTLNHPIRVMNNYGFIVWKKLYQLSEGDSVCIQTESPSDS